MKLLITDLDNTLYDWVTFFAKAFAAMTEELVPLLGVDKEALLDEFRTVHQHYGNSEQPFAVLELPSVKRRFGSLSREKLWRAVAAPLRRFDEERSRWLRLYPGVAETLSLLRRNGTKVVGHTEATAVNAHHRLKALGILEYFEALYALEGHIDPHPDPEWDTNLRSPPSAIHVVPKRARKPNPSLLINICRREGVAIGDACYVGDSLTRDVAMARDAGVFAVWAQYGTRYDPELWDVLVRVTHWTSEDVAREATLKKVSQGVCPDLTIQAYSELAQLIVLGSTAS